MRDHRGMRDAAIALNRFGLGARPGEPPPADPPGALLEQLARFDVRPAPWQRLASTAALTAEGLAWQRELRELSPDARAARRSEQARIARGTHGTGVAARLDAALQSATPFVERLVHFWSNHFAVSVDKPAVLPLAGAFEADAIRPHVTARFEDLLLAALRHPAMLLYLDQTSSTGPNSAAGLRSGRGPRLRGLNENLAREILELHTLGVRSGYTQADVGELARALTGWTLPSDEAAAGGGSFRFAAAMHEPGARRVLDRRYAEAGEEQALAILRDLARAPATARHVAGKLARHFVADPPPPALVQRLARAFEGSGGDLPTVYRALVQAPEAWVPGTTRFKSPWDWTVSGLRALGRSSVPPAQALGWLGQLGQPVWQPRSPAGYDDTDAAWASPDGLLRRLEMAQRWAAQAGAAIDARALAPQLLPGRVGADTETALARADTAATALALLLVSPEFLRR